MHDIIVLISEGLTQSPAGIIKLSELEEKIPIDKRTLKKWISTLIVAQKMTRFLEPVDNDTFNLGVDVKFFKSPFCKKLLDFYFQSFNSDGQINLVDVEGDNLIESLIRAELVSVKEIKGEKYLRLTEEGYSFSTKIRDLVINFYEGFYDIELVNINEMNRLYEKWISDINIIHNDICEKIEKASKIFQHFPRDNALDLFDYAIEKHK